MPAKAINTIFLTIICTLFMPLAQAHTGMHAASGLAAGFLHPLTGLDHMLVAIAAGFWAGVPGRRSGKFVLLFLSLLVAGVVLGMLNLAYPSLAIAPGLALFLATSVIVTAFRVPRLLASASFASFALYHGLAHMLEMPAAVSMATYTAGLLSATALLVAIGCVLRQVTVTCNSGPV